MKKDVNSATLKVSPFTPEMASCIATTMQRNEENKCVKLAVVFCCKFWCCQPDVVHSKILFNINIKVKELKEGEKPPFINKCTMSATQGVGMIYC